ncbi:IclR family transcriptional regulator [Rhodococcus chondri]|uniref:IclR family transcriptional regulator C-terminal domain-containing protein n=1 Tax=Rhodococcus chondri TaxID=3065941 RepID=A0ABU7JSE7_9NOCA|nr:IclR family transcriptional regulator C-terminal domain-containing protein [Rhodococcus sp. CC-R104]MEE2032955.1 IclR family transcriptional regulator C-terminal domain-containing protein [Rhodococcus sp. CC-R104]
MSVRSTGQGGHEPRAVQRALALLEAVATLGAGASARDVAALTRTPPATAYRLLNLLVADGYLVRVEDLSGFALGRRTRELASAAPASVADVDPGPVLEELRTQVRYGIYLASYSGGWVHLVDRDPDHELAGESTWTTHLHASAIGKLLLVQRPELIGDGPLRRITDRTKTEPAELRTELRCVRDADAAHEVDESRIGRTALAVPVRSNDGRVTGALTAIGRTGRISVTDSAIWDLLRSYASLLPGSRTPS